MVSYPLSRLFTGSEVPVRLLFGFPLLAIALTSCAGIIPSSSPDLEIEFRVGSALKHFCEEGAERFNRTNPKLESGQSFQLTCSALGSGDVVTSTLDLARGLQTGSVAPEDPAFPTLLSVDGEVYHSQLRFQMNQLFPGQDYIPDIPDAPLLANSPMVFMVPEDLADGLEQQGNIFAALVEAENHADLDPNSRPLPISFVQTAPTRSNSGLQSLIAQFTSLSGQAPETLTEQDIQQYQRDVQQIQSKVTRYGASTGTLARDMLANGPFWASIGSVYESSVIAANTHVQPGGHSLPGSLSAGDVYVQHASDFARRSLGKRRGAMGTVKVTVCKTCDCYFVKLILCKAAAPAALHKTS